MANPIFHSQYTAQQIEDLITNGAPIIQNGTWWTWDIRAGAYADTGMSAEGADSWHGLAADFDSTVSYSVGDLVMYDGELYVCVSDHIGAWAAADFAKTTVDAQKASWTVALGAYPTESASGAIASTAVGAENIPLKSLSVSITPVQSGSGDPSPINQRPISGWTAANIWVSPTQDAQAGTTIPVNWQDEAGTVYAGTLTYIGNKTCRLEGTHNIVDLGTRTWEYDETYFPGYPFFKAFLPNSAVAPSQPSYAGWCSCYPVLVVSTNTGFVNHDKSLVYCKRSLSSGKRVFIRDTDYDGTTIEQFVASLSGQFLVYQRETPQTYTLTADDVLSLLGDTNVWADTGDVSAVFRCDPNLYIAKQISASVEDAIEGAY